MSESAYLIRFFLLFQLPFWSNCSERSGIKNSKYERDLTISGEKRTSQVTNCDKYVSPPSFRMPSSECQVQERATGFRSLVRSQVVLYVPWSIWCEIQDAGLIGHWAWFSGTVLALLAVYCHIMYYQRANTFGHYDIDKNIVCSPPLHHRALKAAICHGH